MTERWIIVPDLHGSLHALEAIVGHYQLLTADGRWRDHRVGLIQLGDVIDRGPDTPGCLRLIRYLQHQATAANARLVRLLGNHELLLLQGIETFSSWTGVEEERRRLRAEMVTGRIVAAIAVRRWLAIHGGINITQLSLLTATEGKPLRTPSAISRRLNRMVHDAATHFQFHGPIFETGLNGPAGPFWAYLGDSVSDIPLQFSQVVGHRIVEEPTSFLDDQGRPALVQLDTGIFRKPTDTPFWVAEIDHDQFSLVKLETAQLSTGRAWFQTVTLQSPESPQSAIESQFLE